jgi:hypothetical protein
MLRLLQAGFTQGVPHGADRRVAYALFRIKQRRRGLSRSHAIVSPVPAAARPGVDRADDAFKNSQPGNVPKGDDGQFLVAMRGCREDVSRLPPNVSGWWENPEYPKCTRLN